ncbi:MAG: hypothetical protein WD535_04805, partial [Thermaerobacterales bacterium]
MTHLDTAGQNNGRAEIALDDEAAWAGSGSHWERWEVGAAQIAHAHDRVRKQRGAPALLRQLRLNEAALHEGYRYFSAAETSSASIDSYAAEWLLDNYYLVQQSIRQAREDLPAGYYRQLPELAAGPLAGYPRIYAAVQALLSGRTARLNMDDVGTFIQAYQTITPLSSGELWALPTMLRLVTIDNLAGAVSRLSRYQDDETGQGVPDDAPEEEVVAKAVRSLRTLGVQDWKLFFESVSEVEKVLRADPAGAYVDMDFETRNRYRTVVEELSRATAMDEVDVAAAVLELAQGEIELTGAGSQAGTGTEGGTNAARSHIGYYLLDEGRDRLESRLEYRSAWPARASRWVLSRPTLLYLGGIGSLTILLLLAAGAFAFDRGAAGWQAAALGAILLVPAATVAVAWVNWLLTHLLPPRILPKMDFEQGIPAEYSAMVVVPALLTGPGEVRDLLSQLELHYLGNSDTSVNFALLTDFPDAPHREMPDDQAVLTEAVAGIEALNARYRGEGGEPFFLFHRPRLYNKAQGVWMGWERKRGKLAEFNRML